MGTIDHLHSVEMEQKRVTAAKELAAKEQADREDPTKSPLQASKPKYGLASI